MKKLADLDKGTMNAAARAEVAATLRAAADALLQEPVSAAKKKKTYVVKYKGETQEHTTTRDATYAIVHIVDGKWFGTTLHKSYPVAVKQVKQNRNWDASEKSSHPEKSYPERAYAIVEVEELAS